MAKNGTMRTNNSTPLGEMDPEDEEPVRKCF
jgi:hypothetical protein